MPKRIGIVQHLYAQPLFKGLSDNPIFTTVRDSSTQLAIKLRQKELDGAFLSPIEYAKDYAMYRIIPKVAAVSEGESNSVILLFRENLRKIGTVAVNPGSSSEIVLASIIMAEKYDLRVQLVPFDGSIDRALTKADAYLASGDAAIDLRDRANKLDLVDEWSDITGLPFVHGIWVSRENALTPDELKIIIETGEQRTANNPQEFWYDLSDEASTALTEFFRMAYYHGILDDIPDVKFFPL